METHYHSQFDNDEFYDAQVYRLHHELFALLIVALDETAVVPLCFAPVMHHAFHGLDDNDLDFSENSKHGLHSGIDAFGMDLEFQISSLCDLLRIAEQKAWRDYDDLEVSNNLYRHLLNEGENAQAEELFEKARKTEKLLLERFKKTQDALVRIDWYGNVLYPHEILLKNLKLVSGSIHALQNRRLSSALRRLYQVDNNAYAFMFDEDVYNHFTNYVLHQPKERLKWGYGRLMPHENLYGLVKSLLKKQETGETDYEDELRRLTEIRDNQHKLLAETLEELSRLIKTVFL